MSKLERVPGTQLPPLLRVARQINAQSDLAPLSRTVLEEALALARAEAGVLWLRREEQHQTRRSPVHVRQVPPQSVELVVAPLHLTIVAF